MTIKNILFILLISAGGYIYLNYFGEKPLSLVAGVTLTSHGVGKNLGIDFTTPVRYLGHFPEDYGQVLQIQVRSISFSGFDKNYSMMKKIIKSGSGSNDLLNDVRYEGNVPGGPFIVVRFTEPVNFEVEKGDGLQSINVTFKRAQIGQIEKDRNSESG